MTEVLFVTPCMYQHGRHIGARLVTHGGGYIPDHYFLSPRDKVRLWSGVRCTNVALTSPILDHVGPGHEGNLGDLLWRLWQLSD